MWRSWALTKKNADSIMRRRVSSRGLRWEMCRPPRSLVFLAPKSSRWMPESFIAVSVVEILRLRLRARCMRGVLMISHLASPGIPHTPHQQGFIPKSRTLWISQLVRTLRFVCVQTATSPLTIWSSPLTVDDLRWEEIPHVGDVQPPAQSVPFTDVVETAAGRASASNEQHFLLRSNGDVWGKGEQMPGLVGSSDAYEDLGSGGGSFLFNGDLGDWTKLSPTKIGGSVSSIAWGANRLVFLRDDGVVGSWNYNANPLFPTSAPANIVKIVHSGTAIHVLTDGGEIWSVGSNQFGQLGILDSTNSAALNALTVGLGGAFSQTIGDGYTDIAAGTHWSFGRAFVFAVKGGRLWTWGAGGVISARPADPLITNLRGAPVEITDPDIDDIEMVEGGGGMANGMYVSASNGLYIWGLNNVGSLGQGYLSPTTGSGTPLPLKVSAAYPEWVTA